MDDNGRQDDRQRIEDASDQHIADQGTWQKSTTPHGADLFQFPRKGVGAIRVMFENRPIDLMHRHSRRRRLSDRDHETTNREWRARLDDRAREQAKADEYAPLLFRGQKIMVKWVDVKARMAGSQEYQEQHDAAMKWLTEVRRKLEGDFGAAAAARFNLGKPVGVPLGLSEPAEHEARVVELEKMMREMRAGTLPLKIAPQPNARK